MSLLPIVRVVVHPDGALVTRAGPVPVRDRRIEVRQLPLLLDPTTLRARVDGAEIAEIRTEIDLLDEDRGEAPQAVEALRAAREELAALDVEIDASRELRRTLADLAPAFRDDPRRPLPDPDRFTAWLAADRAIAVRVEALDETLRSLVARRAELAERVAVLEHAAHRVSTEERWRRWLPTRRVAIRIGGAAGDGAEGAAEVELSYRITGARWSPAYVLDADEALRTGRFSMRASVVQATGEDWRGVALELSSAPSERWIDVPELAALRLGTRQPPVATGWRALPADLDRLFPAELDQGPIPTAAPAPPPAPARPTVDVHDGVAPAGEVTDHDDIELADAEPMEDDDDDDLSEVLEPVSGATPGPAPVRPTMAPPTAAAPASAPPRSGGVGRALGAMVGAPLAAAGALAKTTTLAVGGGGPPSRPAPRPARAERRRVPPADAEGPIDVDIDWLQYGQLRLADWTAGPGRRGRLRPASHAELLAERGAPPEARAVLAEHLRAARTRAHGATARPLPPHHVVPGPIQGNDVRIEAQGAVDVPADGLPHSVAVASWPAELEVAYRTVPRADPRAFRRVTARLQYDRALLPGPVDVYVEGKLELTSPWAGSAGRGVLRIGLGAEDRLKVARNVRYTEASAGVFGGSRRLQTDIEVRIASSLPRPVSVEILERLPVPLDGKEITVEQTEASPVAEPYEGEPDGRILKGGRRQVLEVPPGGEARAVLGYAVTLGAKDEIVGGDRRG